MAAVLAERKDRPQDIEAVWIGTPVGGSHAAILRCVGAADDASVVVSPMAATLNQRMDIVELKVKALETLPDRVTALEHQVGRLRIEMREEDEKTRQLITGSKEETRRLITESEGETRRLLTEETRRLITESKEETRRLIAESEEETRRLVKESDEETRRFMRILHEEVIDRIKTIGESSR
jgi:F0F1-type ATP synthase membrane subunit b/b'